MKIITPLLSILLVTSCADAKETIFIGSTPAGPLIRSFLGIPFSDSVDFVRWKLLIRDNRYQLQYNYGIGEPNTNGFIDGGKKQELNDECRKEKNYYQFQNGTSSLKAVELNANLLHLLNTDNSLLVGNGGWSYTLNNAMPVSNGELGIIAPRGSFKDSTAFEGRTPCNVPGVITPGTQCYKLKWYVILYAPARPNQQGSFKVLGTPWRKEGGITGSWQIIAGKKDQVIYELDYNNRNKFLYLLKLDSRVFIFTDRLGNLLVGDEDFSYTLNRKW